MSLFNDLFAFIKEDETIEDSAITDNNIQFQAKDTSPNTEKCGNPAVDNFCKALSEFEQLSNVFQRPEANFSKAEANRNGKKEVPTEDSKKYKCDYCHISSNRSNNIERHIRKVHDVSPSKTSIKLQKEGNRCINNDKVSQSKEEKYRKQKERESRGRNCIYCGEEFRNYRQCFLHTKSVHQGIVHKCDVCDYVTARSDGIRSHTKKVHYNIRPFNCDECDYKAQSKTSLRDHVNRRHRDIKFTCPICSFSCKSDDVLKRHNNFEHNGIGYPCSECHYKAKSATSLKDHLHHVHYKLKEFTCEHCPFKTTYRDNMKTHIQGQHEGVKYSCNQCDYKCTAKGMLLKHNKLKHLSLEFKKCDECDYQSVLQGRVNFHKRTVHSNVKFSCKLCSIQTSSTQSLRIHMKLKHDDNPKKLLCDQCDYKGFNMTRLKEHKRAVHDKIKFPCSECSFQTTSKNSLVIHKRSKHEGINHKCDHCNHQSASKSDLKRHSQNKHPAS